MFEGFKGVLQGRSLELKWKACSGNRGFGTRGPIDVIVLALYICSRKGGKGGDLSPSLNSTNHLVLLRLNKNVRSSIWQETVRSLTC